MRLRSIAKYQNSFASVNSICKNTFFVAYLICDYTLGLIQEIRHQRYPGEENSGFRGHSGAQGPETIVNKVHGKGILLALLRKISSCGQKIISNGLKSVVRPAACRFLEQGCECQMTLN